MLETALNPTFWISVLQIIAIDILLGGDNAIVIALACRRLPEAQRKQGIFWGVVGAIALRVILIFFALQLLAIPFLKIVGGLLLLWIGIKLLQPEEEVHDGIEGSTHLLGAIRTIIIADAVMSLDNVIAVAAAAKGDLGLVVFGILMVVNMEVGMCHPPVGLNLYVASGITKMGITELTVATWPWLLTMLVFLVIVTYWPPLSLWLPRQLGMIS